MMDAIHHLIRMTVVVVNENNPLGFVAILSFLFLYCGTFRHIYKMRMDSVGARYDEYERLIGDTFVNTIEVGYFFGIIGLSSK